MPDPTSSRPMPPAIVGAAAFLTIGWTGLLMPSLIRSIEASFQQTDAGMGLVYLLYAAAYALGSFGGGPATERLGRRTVLTAGAALHALGFVGLALAPAWAAFVVFAVPAGYGAGTLDGGVNGLYLDLFRSGRGKALNLLHLAFSLSALSAPLVVGALVDGGVGWATILLASAAAPLAVAIGFAGVRMPSGRHGGPGADAGTGEEPATGVTRVSLPLALLGLAILAYVAAEVGVSNWIVRYLGSAPLSTATLALSLFWGGLAVGRLISARIADRFDHVRFTVACAIGLAVALLGAIVVPSLPVSIALVTRTGVACGPIFPMIIAIGGERHADRSAGVGALLTGFGVVGGTVYPPLMGVLSVTVGLTAAMLGNVLLGLVCAAALVAFARRA